MTDEQILRAMQSKLAELSNLNQELTDKAARKLGIEFDNAIDILAKKVQDVINV